LHAAIEMAGAIQRQLLRASELSEEYGVCGYDLTCIRGELISLRRACTRFEDVSILHITEAQNSGSTQTGCDGGGGYH